MPWALVVFIVVVAVVSAIAQTIKKQQDNQPPPPRRRPNRSNAGGVKTGSSDMDRFLQEIEKLRKRPGGEESKKPAKNGRGGKAVPTVAPVKRPKRSDGVPTIAPSQRVDRLPAATVLPTPPLPSSEPSPISQSAPQPDDAPSVSRAPKPVGKTQFGRSLLEMLGDKQSLPLAVVLNEVLGPPKCKQK
ncbi:hypothetical protein [Limnoglobus roseus]|uniref:Uncharacterized protein n=1 Tax=Limnoglobus roseus TaxID=2598579 RepID=A0A5C1ALU7_9BACT|nr:hypothetical protein [Limnoglobus roseus]QEL18144.1 hypothetical protein PX52LOC_05158 [Limnoglobus roseus]